MFCAYTLVNNHLYCLFHCIDTPYMSPMIIYNLSTRVALKKLFTLVDQLNDAFSKTHPWLAQKALTRAGRVAISKISGNAFSLRHYIFGGSMQAHY